MFANDFGYGRLGGRMVTVCSHMIKGQGHLPILLSHWDADHYRIAKSVIAKKCSGSVDDVTYRPWVAPGGEHMGGPVAQEMAWSIQQHKKLLQWPKGVKKLESANVAIVCCEHNPQYPKPDKNNDGALALIIGSGNDFLIYPGDANYESIPNISDWSKSVSTLIATHHGSTVALKGSGGTIGGNIPIASSKESYALFSYAKGNTYGHDIETARGYYEAKGYKLLDTTATFHPGEDTFEITNFGHGAQSTPNAVLMVAPANPSPQSNQPPMATGRNILPGLQATSMPQPPPNWANAVQKQPREVLDEDRATQFPALLTLSGSGGAAPKPDQDDLLEYAIRDEEGDIVLYDVKASKIVLQKLPLCIPCNTDYPVTVQLICRDLEFGGVVPQAGVVPLVRFDVANGFEWAHGADAGQAGEPGNQGFAGGCLRLAVAGEWTRTGEGASSPMSGLSIQYRGGCGSNGQDGGNGIPVSNPWEIKPRESANGGTGGDAGAPGTIATSEVLAVSGKWPASWTVVIDTAPGTDSEFGKPSTAGKGRSPLSQCARSF